MPSPLMLQGQLKQPFYTQHPQNVLDMVLPMELTLRLESTEAQYSFIAKQ